MREQLLLLIRISKPEYNKCLYDEYKLYMNPHPAQADAGHTKSGLYPYCTGQRI